MNKRVPLLLSLIGVIVLAASIAYWFLQLYQPPQRPIAAVPLAQMPDPSIDAAATLFGGQVAVASATNYQLTGVVADGRNSVAIIVADGSPPKALIVGKEVSPGVTLSEVYPRYVMLSDGGVKKRVDLAPDTKAAAPMGGTAGNAPPVTSNPGVPNGAIMQPPVTPVGNAVAEPPMAPGAVVQQMPANNPNQAVPPPQMQNGAQIQNGAPIQNNSNNPNPNNQTNPAQASPTPGPPPVQMAPATRPVTAPGSAAPAVR